jgi:predicted phage terminase large subunit-like protein
VHVSGDKFTRALAWANRAEAGKIALVRGGWIDDFIEEACRFPHGKHDDQIDAVSLAVQMMTVRKRRGWGF